MYWLYSILLVFWGVILLPAFLYKAWRHKKSLPGLSQRLGRLPAGLRYNGRQTIWFHSCSVGETLSLQPLVQNLHRQLPGVRFVFSTITKTGHEIALQRFGSYGEGNAFYFPIDLAFVVRRVLDWIRPSMIVIVDTEIWPNTLNQARCRGIPVMLVNGRISSASFRFYRPARPILKRVLRNYRALMMQSDEDAARIARMGAPADKITVTGNIKIDRDLPEGNSNETLLRSLDEAFGFSELNTPLIVAGSTHPGEEQILLDVLGRLRRMSGLEQTRLLLAPRHPERFDSVAQLAAQSNFGIQRRTGSATKNRDAEVLILDTVGELAAAYRFATVAFVGGTLIRHGGHSILEPALYSKAIVTGPSMESFRQLAEEFRLQGGLRQISAGENLRDLQVQQLLDVFAQLLQNAKEREALGRAAYCILEKSRGATRRASETISMVFEELRGK
ncbi:MAG: 3-deoxy-D-manno-octulosonic acid transferase [Acidobacteria bacterium]|nr:3-deoxy-D-manno-octulosonic acid transferase [Acidobacteriota bacterium]